MTSSRKQRFTIPKPILAVLEEQPRFVVDPAPGFWPIDIAILQKTDFLDKLAKDKQFQENFEIVIMPR